MQQIDNADTKTVDSAIAKVKVEFTETLQEFQVSLLR